jgi:hypothetical protein
MTHLQLRAAIVEHVVKNWSNTSELYADWIQSVHKTETVETYTARMLGPKPSRGNFPELAAAAAVLKRHIEIYTYAVGDTTLKWEEIVSPANVNVEGPNISLVRIGDDQYHVGIRTPGSAGESQRTETANMLGLLDKMQKLHQDNARSLQQPPPPPPKHLKTQQPHEASDKGTEEGAESQDNSASSDNEGSDDSEERRAKKRITPDAKYQFLGDDYGFLRLPPKKRVIKNKMRNNLQKKWVMSMKRHWKTQKQNACMAAITIKRCDLSKVGDL